MGIPLLRDSRLLKTFAGRGPLARWASAVGVIAVMGSAMAVARDVPAVGGPAVEEHGDDKLAAARKLGEQIVSVPSNELRTRLFEQLIEQCRDHEPVGDVIREAIRELWEKSNRRLGRKSNLRVFKKLVEARGELDALRASTLALIRHPELYPYPYKAPHASPEAVKAYLSSQESIDDAVEAMRALWRKSPSVKMPALMQKHLALALWTRRANKRADAELAVSVKLARPDVPPWIYGLPLEGELPKDAVTIESFGLSLVEARMLAEGRAILAWNNAQLEEALAGAMGGRIGGAGRQFEQDRIRDEFDQVRATNDYRRLFGLQVLAWDGRLYAACRQHAEYLWESGYFGHVQPTVEFATFADRAKRAGYTEKVYENCHKGSNQPFDVLKSLAQSSAHHRTMLLESVHEIATARSGLAWVQNYGLDMGFRSAIQWEAWRD